MKLKSIFYKKFIGINFILLFILLSITGIASLKTYNILPTKNLIFLFIILSSLVVVFFTMIQKSFYINLNISFIVGISLIYILITFINSVILHKVYIFDYLVEYLSFIYLIILSLLYNKVYINKKILKKFFLFLVFMFFIKYSISHILNLMDRPGIFTENNYELLFLALLTLAYYHVFKKLSFILIVTIGFIYVLAESRSGILIFSILLIYIYTNLNFKKKRNILIFFIIFSLSISLILVVIKYRMNTFTIENIDRFHFLLVFLKETQEWDIFKFLIGQHPLSPLSYSSCKELSFYKDLFSYSGENICYAVILHAFLLRIVFDHGILGLLFIFFSTYKIILLSGYSKKESIIVTLLLLLNGMSVSSLNNIFTLAGLIILTNIGYFNKIGHRL